MRIVGGLFSAIGIEKTTLVTGATKIAVAPTDPVSYFVFTRAVYLTDWVQETLGEANKAVGCVTPWPGPFVPLAVTAPVNHGLDKVQSGAIAGYVYVFHKISIGADSAISGCESAWGRVVWLFVWRR